MSFFSNLFNRKKQVYAQPNLRPRSGNSLFNFMILAASCTGGYVLFHSQRRELAALHAEDNNTAAGASAATSAGAGATSGVDSATSGGAGAGTGAGQESGESKS